MLENNLYKLTGNDVESASRMFKRAFYDDPMLVYFFPEEAEREELGDIPFLFTLRMITAYGTAVGTSPSLEGAILYTYSDSAFFSSISEIRQGIISLFFKMGPGAGMRGITYDRHSRKLHAKLIQKRHVYLNALAVEPVLQGNGKSRALMEHIIGHAESCGLPVYLETTSRRNLEFYRHFGFTVLAEHRIPGSDCIIWPMLYGK